MIRSGERQGVSPPRKTSETKRTDDAGVSAMMRDAEAITRSADALPLAGAIGWRRGFTLIELLVSISIIALLLSLILPAVNSAREAISHDGECRGRNVEYAADRRKRADRLISQIVLSHGFCRGSERSADWRQ